MIFTHEITLDVTINQIKTLNIKQYTKGSFKLHVTLTDRCEPFQANKNTHHCYFKMETPDKKHIFTDATINDDGSVDISIPEKACLAAGSGTAELVFKEQTEDTKDTESIFATMNLNVNIIPSAYHNSNITSSDDFDALHQALFAADKTYDQVMTSAAASALLAQSYAKGGTNSREHEETDNAKYYKEEAENAENSAADHSSDAQSAAQTANTKAGEATDSATAAAASANAALNSKEEAAQQANMSKSYAIGHTGLRGNEDEDCAKHYSEQAQYYCNLAQDVKDSLGSALRPMGTRTFTNLPALADVEAGDMYNVSDQFTTNGNFEEGAGVTVPAGSNVYKTVGGKWDILAGSPVTGIKGNAESSYRKGNVNITPANIGLGSVNNTADSVKNVNSAGNLRVLNDNYKQGTDLPSTYPRGVTVFFSINPANKFNGITYCTIHTIKGYNNMACIQFLYPYNTDHDKVYFREALYNNDAWRPWHEVITTANIASQNVASATKATQDGDGNAITDTYAKKSIYGDDAVGLGRKYMSTIGERSATLGGTENIASGRYSATLGGEGNKTSNEYTVALGGKGNVASSRYSATLGGRGLSTPNDSAVATGHYNVRASQSANEANTLGTAFIIGNGTSATALSNAFSVMFDGRVKAKSTITGSTTADYAEFFEWLDGNPDAEDRVGRFVTLAGNKIAIADSGASYILGIVSGEPFVLGNGDCDTWNGMFLKDDFNRTIYEPAPKMKPDEGTGELAQETDGDGNLVYEGTRPKLNPEYDPTQPYISRFDRKEWAPVGMLGVLSVIDDGTCLPNQFCKCGTNGIATLAENREIDTFFVIERISDNVISVILK